MGRFIWIIVIALSGLFIFQNRYRVLNIIFKNAILRRIMVSSLLGIPGIRERLMRMLFPSDSTAVT
ncbi:hypothetical protein KDN24_09650 [Bacillus sp. Bva_UNVM-123]|uniref:hypothetical protein n=1 Tax=Bacillus sp. Bva_UNVM-123 TaxID=2829798 RepID=UPI00391EF262